MGIALERPASPSQQQLSNNETGRSVSPHTSIIIKCNSIRFYIDKSARTIVNGPGSGEKQLMQRTNMQSESSTSSAPDNFVKNVGEIALAPLSEGNF